MWGRTWAGPRPDLGRTWAAPAPDLGRTMHDFDGERTAKLPPLERVVCRLIRVYTPAPDLATMPRPRHVIPGTPLHITQRGVDRCPTFIADDDFALYLWVLHAASQATDCAVHAYVLMTNHVHLLLTPGDMAGPARLMRAIGTRYVRYFNDRYRRTGTLWEGRFRSTAVDTDSYFFACSRYIERNPQRAGLTDDPATYMWSSFRCNAHGEPDRIVTPHPLYTSLGADTVTRSRTYRRLFAIEQPPTVIAAVRTASRARRALPDTSYQQAVAAMFGSSSGSTRPSETAIEG